MIGIQELPPQYVEINGAQLAVWERPGSDPPIVLCHATSFHAHTWKAVIDRCGDRRCLTLDMRGHGRSDPAEPPIQWRMFGADVAALVRHFRLSGALGVGHSMGGHAVCLAAALVPEAFSRLLLLDPVILPEEAYTGPIQEPHFARKRRNQWSSWQEMWERFRSRPPFDRWDPQVLHDYCEYALTSAGDSGGFKLACPPEVEGSIYEQSRAPESNIYPEIRRIKIPVKIIRAAAPRQDGPAMDMNGSPTTGQLVTRFADAEEAVVGYSHFIPMEAPEFVAAEILRA